jgi:transposase
VVSRRKALVLLSRLGLPYGKVAQLRRDRFRLPVTRGGLVHAMHRAARQARPSYAALCATVRGSPVVTPDETSWRVGPDLLWLWVFVTRDTTVYAIQPGAGSRRPRPSSASTTRASWSGTAGSRIGNSPTPRIRPVSPISCAPVAASCWNPQQPFVTAVKAILQEALATRARHHAGAVSDHGLAVARGHDLARLGTMLARRPSRRLTVARFQRHLITEYDAIFSFLFDPTLDATNWRAEHAIRPHRAVPLRPRAPPSRFSGTLTR